MTSPQGTQEWRLDRLGYATASMFHAVMAKGDGKTRKSYMLKLAAERLTGIPVDGFSNKHMERGIDQEPYARLTYEARIGNIVQSVGFVKHHTLMAGCSSDGLIDHDGGVEIKSVIPTVQIETIQRGTYPPEHKAQIQGALWITGRQWWDFVSYSPAMPEHLKLHVYRVMPDADYINDLEKSVAGFLTELDALVAKLQKVDA